MDATELTDILRGHYLAPNRPAGGLFAAEVGSPCGRRRADALWLPLTRAGGTGLVGHELKVSRSDVLAELADPTKAEPWSQYCSHWWLVVSDPALVEGLALPESWGVMSPPSGRRTRSMTIIRQAPKLRPMEPALGLRRLLGWHFYGTQERLSETEWRLATSQREVERLRRELAQARAGGSTQSPESRRVAGIIHEAEKRLERDHIWGRLDDEAVIAALVDATATRKAAETMRRDLETLSRQLNEPLKYAREAVAQALKVGGAL
jgi:hypothetical protein